LDDSNQKALLRRLNDLRAIAVSQAARVTSREPDQEAKRRWAIVEQIEDIKKRLPAFMSTAELSAPVNPQIDAIAEKIEATQQTDDASADFAARRSMAQWIQYEREQKALEVTRSQLARLHESAQPDTSSPEPGVVALLSRILDKKNIGLETWLGDHPHIKRSTFMDWKAAGGKPVKGKVSVAKAREIEAAIRQADWIEADAIELGLM
jgi:hypothetical protein